MIRKQIEPKALDAWIDGLIGRMRVVGVQAKNGRFAFGDLARASDLRLDYDVTILPPKKYFLPAVEDLLRFRGAEYESVDDAAPLALVGVHPYDMAAILQMDKVFSKDNRDEHYLRRRERAAIVVCDILSMSENTFAGAMGTAVVGAGFDVLLTKVGGLFVAEAGSEKGARLMEPLAGMPDADAVALARREQLWEDNQKLMRRHDLRPALSSLPDLLGRSYDHPVWEEKSAKCFSCGSCNLVCPTCYCFDVRDDVNWDLKSGTRGRAWDGCMLTDFATVAGRHNFRKKRADRYRHRYYRKGKFVPEMIGDISCVGCGRCVTACVPGIANPAEVFNRLAEVS